MPFTDQPSPAALAALAEIHRTAGPTGTVPVKSVSADVRHELLSGHLVGLDGDRLYLKSRGLRWALHAMERSEADATA